ncbi:peptidase M23-like protein [Natranaerovirga pectinivora]|uniref:Peptidase M23-like protein n=1 Tax=Natranaerovirga pectinivora TaxID=682400 RepID=A0A4R3MEU2_9FIRM|nr:M23 family metallopeptidase [Natranaerovirga pectinivora]TCT12184.1 peptidase M23-like protein [Natranaerovirga pectinivora]
MFTMKRSLQKKHKKRNKYITMMLIPDPTKKARAIKIPKWISYPILISIIVITISVINMTSYITKLENDLEEQNNLVKQTYLENENHIAEINALHKINEENYQKLESIISSTEDLRQELEKLSEHQQQIDEIFNNVEKTTQIQPSNMSLQLSRVSNPINLTYLSTTKDVNSTSFDDHIGNIEKTLDELSMYLNKEIDVYQQLEEQVEEMIPFWEAYPSILPVDGRVTSNYGWRRNPFGGPGYEFHNGIDLSAYYNTPVKATGKGEVIYVGYDHLYGRMAIIDHGYGIVTKYAHNTSITVKKGEVVKRGDIIAKSGSTGRSTGPHVHYEVLLNGKTQNPINYIYKGE